jgi:hypothetical protein
LIQITPKQHSQNTVQNVGTTGGGKIEKKIIKLIHQLERPNTPSCNAAVVLHDNLVKQSISRLPTIGMLGLADVIAHPPSRSYFVLFIVSTL